MSKLEFKELVPELRFSQTEWQKKPFNKIYILKTTNSLSRDKLNYDDGLVKNIHYGDIHTKFSTLFDITKEYVPFINTEISLDKVKEESYCQEGDMIFADASEDIDDVGKSIELINLNGEKLLSGLHTILARQKGSYLVKGFGGYLFKSEVMRKQIQKESQGAKVLGISASRISNIEVIYPIDHDEQQKIADCLSSMDDLITTNTKKLELLKLHKKGLLQKLFTAEGKDIPELRFDGFEGEWEEVELRKLGDLISGLTYSPDDVRASGLLVLRSSNVQNGKIVYEDNVFVEPNIKGANISEPDDILICVRNGSKALIGKNALIPKNVPLSTHGAFMTIFRSKYAQFTFQLFQTNAYQKQVDADLGATINSINGKQLLKYKFKIPRSNDEKEKIVKCLSSLDDLINAQTDKIEVLTEYKKGLMQQLFPKIKESIA
ncbi:restriction endonuclease subunit S [Vibrio cholerae]